VARTVITKAIKKRRPLLASLAALVAAVSAAGCVSMPTGGPVLSYPVTQGPEAQNQPYVQIVPQKPRPGWSPVEIVQGFLTASASIGDYSRIANDYLTPQESNHWTRIRSWSAVVYKSGPFVKGPATLPASPKASVTVTVTVTGQAQAHLQGGSGSYSVPSGSAADEENFTLVKVGGQWRIADAPSELLLTSDSFANDYQLRNLYFFDPTGRYLVPDPVYVPLQKDQGDLMNGLVNDLISPPADWLRDGGATRTALPPGTKIRGVTFSGVTAVVNLTGTIVKAAPSAMRQVSAQLLRTLADPGPGAPGEHPVQSIEIELDGKPWTPPGSPGNPVQPYSKKLVAASPVFYYVDSAGYLNSQDGPKGKPSRGLRIGAGASSSVSVSPDGHYLAVLRGSTLYTGLITGPLAKRGTGYRAMSWDVNDDLWASHNDHVVLLRDSATSKANGKQPLGQQVTVSVTSIGSGDWSGPYTALRVAPDGVRVAIVVNGHTLTFGAISGRLGPNPQITTSQVQLDPPAGTTFTGLTWYGPDNVVTLAGSGPVATEYPVSGGPSTPIPVDPGMRSITASYGNLLIAGMPKGRMESAPGLTSAWMPMANGYAPAYPG
jgi:Lipoprotein LpqB beta-propeller domain/Sporulation and spore germination